MKIKSIAKELLIYILCAVLIWYMIQSIHFSKEILNDVSKAVYRCINTVFPSLFGIMVLSDFLIRSRLYKKIGIIFMPLSKFVFNMPHQLFIVFLLSNIGGYPVGAKLIKQLLENGSIDRKTAENMSVFCYASGPSFITGIIGVGVFSSVRAGIIIYLSCLLANIIAAIIFGLFEKYSYTDKRVKLSLNSQTVIDLVSSSGKNMLMICLMVICFSYVISVLDCLSAFDVFRNDTLKTLVKSLAEITYITNLNSDYRLLPAVAFLASTGGLCVILQLASIINHKFSMKKFILARIPIAILSYVICIIMMKLIPVTNNCVYSYSYQRNDSKFNILSVVCIFFMIIIIFFQKKTSNLQKDVL